MIIFHAKKDYNDFQEFVKYCYLLIQIDAITSQSEINYYFNDTLLCAANCLKFD